MREKDQQITIHEHATDRQDQEGVSEGLSHGVKPKILIISMSYFPRYVGGAEVALKELTDRLGDAFEFHMITARFASDLPRVSQEGSVLVHRIGWSFGSPSVADLRKPIFRLMKMWFQLGAFFAAQRLHRKHQYKMIWGMMAHSADVPSGLFKRFHPDVPYLLTLQEGDPPEHIERQMRMFGSLFPAAFRRADAVQTISTFLADWAKRMGAKRIQVVPNGVDLARFTVAIAPERRTELRKRMNAKEDEVLLVTASRLVPKNGIDTVIEALPQLPSRVRFAIAGEGPERERLMTLAKRVEVSDRVVFLGEVSHADLPAYLRSSDVFIRASRSEGMGNAFIEAMAAGLPTIGTNVGGIPDFLRDYETGYLIESENPEAVTSAVLRVIEQPIETNHIADGGQRLARERYGWDHIAEEMHTLIRSLV